MQWKKFLTKKEEIRTSNTGSHLTRNRAKKYIKNVMTIPAKAKNLTQFANRSTLELRQKNVPPRNAHNH